MKKTNILVMVMLLMGLAFVVNMDTASAASSIYVNVTSGNDAWNGQSQFYTNGTNGPKKTINGGVTVVDANGTVNLADGIYSGNGNNGITIGKNLTIKGQSKDGTIINGSNSNQIFTISSGVNVSLLNITIANAKSSNSGGSAIKNNGGTLTINNCTFKNNNASRTSWSNDIYGGAIYSTGPLTIINSTFINNSAYGQDYIAQGGAIYSTGPLTIIDSTFTNNSALGSGGSNLVVGGAISIQNSLNITRSTFTNNMAGSRVGTEGFGGGALYIGTNTAPIANVSISESNFINNSATYGGAIWMNAGSSTKFATITKCTFVGNDAKNGGAIRNWGYLNLTNSYFTNNTATADGAAIYNYQGALNVNFNQIINDTGNLEIYVNSGAVNATNNWWGSNTNVSSKVSNGVNVSTWLVLLLTRSPQTVLAGYTSTIIADLNHDQNGVYYDPADGHIPDGTPVIFTSTLGTINSAVMINGIATVTFTAGNTPGVATINATVNGYTNSTTVTIVPLATIILYQTVNTPVNVGDKVTFLVTATNNGPNTATNINIRDFIPAGLTGVTVTTSTGTYNSTTGIWTITSLANGSSAVLNITGTASAAMAGKITNNTATEISQTQNTTQLPSSTKGVYTKMADVVMSQTVTTPVNVGDVVTYIVSIINIGPDAATNFIIRDIIPDGLLNVVVTPSTGTYSNGNWTVPFLANGDSTTLTITAVASAAMAGKNTTNTATKIFETEYDPTTIGESVSSDAYTKEADLVVTNTANGDRLNVGEMGTFTVVVTNNGPDDATNIVITNDALPDGFTASWDNGNYENNIWTISSLASGESATITFTCDALYDSYAGTTITNHIEVDLTEYPFTVNVDDSSIYVKMANVAINQTGSYNKNNVTFVVNVKNNGPDNATNILIENTIPEGLTNVVFTPSIGTYDSETGIWTIPLLTNGQVATLTVTGTAVPQSTIFNRISIISQDEYSQDSKKSFGATYLPESDVRVSLYTSTGKYTNWDVNNVVSWVAEIINLGPDDAHDVVVTVLLPDGLEFAGADTRSNGFYEYDSVNRTITWYLDFMPSSGGAFLNFFTLINKSGDLTVTLSKINQSEFDPNTANNVRSKTLPIPQQVDIKVIQSVNNISPNIGDIITYTIFIQNNGPGNATGLTIKDLLPSGLNFVSADTHGVGTYDPDTGIWNIGNFNNTHTATLTINAIVGAINTIKNTAKLETVNQFDWNFNNNAQTTIINQGDYTKTSDVRVSLYTSTGKYTNWDVNNVVSWVAEIINLGPDDAHDVVVTVLLPDGLEFAGADTRSNGFYEYDSVNRTITWYLDFMPSSGGAFLNFFTLINKSGDLTVTLSKINQSEFDPNTANNVRSKTLPIPQQVNLVIDQDIDGLNITEADVGEEITINIIIENQGDDATGLTIKNLLPDGFDFVSADTHGVGTYDPDTGIWNIGNFNSNEKATLSITVIVNNNADDTLITTAKLETVDQFDWNFNDNSKKTYLNIMERGQVS